MGNGAHYVAVRPDRDPQPVRRFECFTADHFFIIGKQQPEIRTENPEWSLYHNQEIAFRALVRQQRSNCAIHGGKLSFLMHRKS